MKMTAALFVTCVSLLATVPGQARTMEALENDRLTAVRIHVVNQANRPGTLIHQALDELRQETIGMAEKVEPSSVSALEIGSEICAGRGADSAEERTYVVALKYLSGQRSNFDDDMKYRSNVALYATLRFRCQMSARAFGSPQVKWNCEKE